MDGNHTVINTLNSVEHSLWKHIWSMAGPPKLKHPSCCKCAREEENVIHALLKCSSMDVVWRNHPSMPLLNQAPISSFNDLLRWMWDHAIVEELTDAVSLMWALLFIKNKQVILAMRIWMQCLLLYN